MKRIIIISILVAITISVYSQNWNLINNNKKYNYSYGLSTDYNTTVMVDSIKIINGDSIFYLNRIVTNCNTCQNNYYNSYLLYNQPTFLMRKIKKHNNIYTFNDTISYTFIPNASNGTSWTFDTINNITAQIINLAYDTVVGVWDSIKYIRLSTNDTLIISKSFGIVKFQLGNAQNRYKLIGVETPNNNHGFAVPMFRDFYDFNVGDVFQYHISSFYGGWGGPSFYDDYKKVTILTKNYSNNTINYTVCNNGLYSSFNPGAFYYYNTTGSISYTNSGIYELSNLNNNELFYDNVNGNGNANITKVVISKDNNGIIQKSCGSVFGNNIPAFYYILIGDTLCGQYDCDYIIAVGVGIGQTVYDVDCFESSYHYDLIGYVKNGDTTGVVNQNYTVKVENNNLTNNIQIYPNPTNNTLNITNAEKSDISIYNLLGEVVLKTKCNDANATINVSKLTSGTYIIKIISERNAVVKQLIIDN